MVDNTTAINIKVSLQQANWSFNWRPYELSVR
jgi:hypothetical protein